ncbi:unnamed protein product [Caenorhabditis nigoni]
MSSDENPPSPEFKVPNNPVDLSLSQQERAQVTAFYKKRQEMIANNRILLCHTIQYEHSMIPQGIGITNNIPFHNGFPDLSSLIPPSELIKEVANILKNGAGRQS